MQGAVLSHWYTVATPDSSLLSNICTLEVWLRSAQHFICAKLLPNSHDCPWVGERSQWMQIQSIYSCSSVVVLLIWDISLMLGDRCKKKNSFDNIRIWSMSLGLGCLQIACLSENSNTFSMTKTSRHHIWKGKNLISYFFFINDSINLFNKTAVGWDV